MVLSSLQLRVISLIDVLEDSRVFWDCRTWRGSQIGLPRRRHRMFPYTYTQYRGINVIWDSTKLWVVRDWASWLHPTQNATDIGISQGTPGTGRQCDAWPKSVGVVGRAVFQYKKRVFRLLWKPCRRKIRGPALEPLKPSNSKVFNNSKPSLPSNLPLPYSFTLFWDEKCWKRWNH